MILENVCLRQHNTFGFTVSTRYYLSIKHLTDLSAGLTFACNHDLPVLLLGGGSNIVLSRDFNGITLHLQLTGMDIIASDDSGVTIKVYAGENWHQLVLYCQYF